MAADMNIIATNMHHVAHVHASMAINLERMQNVPAFNQGADILQAVNELSLRIDNRFDSILNVGEINELLQAYGLPVLSNIGLRQSRLKRFIGIVVAMV
ncbi:hypothetical protein Q9L58_001538 [Maublancomyces gigas]|uniref:Uncharacterized protein n=1 Tax=Discina gigas TaxID=1032678 RepID=A0ABR3GUB9_9PEZI